MPYQRTLDISKILLTIKRDELQKTSREVLCQIGCRVYKKEKEAEIFSELAKIRNTLTLMKIF